ncbi:ATP-binding cassette transporter [Selaginella moellendorffii]|uniref:ATP-binding cassette transporter n=2 Tax=Selaginella moellendorffii TaxID=88036 RepID=D8RIL0_SELML|nr:ATP-binding cassette transporter [Selaginella moellendorffii]
MYMSSLLSQSVGDVDNSTANVIDNVTSNLVLVQKAIGEKIGNIIYSVAFFLGGYLVAVVLIWRISLLLLPCTPLLILPSVLYARIVRKCAQKRLSSQKEGGTIVKQAISNIRVAYAFTSEKRTLQLYSSSLEKVAEIERVESLAKGVTVGLNGISLMIWALLMWYGSKLVAENHGTGAQILVVGVGFMISSAQLQTAISDSKGLIEGQNAMKNILQAIERAPFKQCQGRAGLELRTVEGHIAFKSVSFSYPSRPTQLALEVLTLDIPAGKVTALVGRSGSGKSTVIALLERFYHPTAGEITLDGVCIRSLDLNWWRCRIGLVSQEPTLLSSSIRQNILYGNERASMADIIAAAKLADAHDFIQRLPNGYDTQVGELGTQISGGQKQRIAIARAIVRKPRIMLLDEATSALDNESERVVQEALDNACKDVTTVTISHRLKSIQNAHYVAVMDGGKVLEAGRQQQLLSRRDGIYAGIVKNVNRSDTDLGVLYNGFEHLTYGKNISEGTEQEKKAAPSSVKGTPPAQKQGCSTFLQILSLNSPEWKHGCMIVVSATLTGFITPANGVLNGVTVAAFYSQTSQELKHTVRFACGLYILASVALFIANFNLHYRAGVTGAALTMRIRRAMLAKIFQQEVGWFEKDGNSSGQIYNRLGNDAKTVGELFWDRGQSLVQVITTVVFCMSLSFCLSWKLAVVASIPQLLIAGAFYARSRSLIGLMRQIAAEHKRVSDLANDAASQQKTITAYCLQDTVLKEIKATSARTLAASQVAGFLYGFCFFALYNFYALCIWYGGTLLVARRITFQNFVICYSALVSAGRALAETAGATPAVAHGLTAKASVLEILNKKTAVSDVEMSGNEDNMRGEVEFRDVSFTYPSSMEILVLKNFSIKVDAGQTAALVGRSGTGKSTVIALLERFYEPTAGTILLDGKDMRSIHVHTLRKQMALVNQEPALFAMSIRDNIAYGLDNATDAEIIEAASVANAHTFISALPEGYETNAGEGGVLLSGGQKQRIAIARAVMKKPAILLLDEATSALDGESERTVQQALDKIVHGSTAKTTIIVVAHRLSTIQHADLIAVMENGGVSEQGKHQELLAKNGRYFALIHSQL